MADQDVGLLSLNAGEISRKALARIDLAKAKVAAEVQSNWLPEVLGPCSIRPGTAFLDHTKSDLASANLEFIYDATTKALLVCTPLVMRVMVDGVYVTRVSVATAVTNGTFPANLGSWTDSDEAGATSAWASAGSVELIGTGTNYAFRDQQVAVAGPDANKEHALRIVVNRGTVRVQVGTAQGLGDYRDDTLAQGTYSLAFTPTTTFWIRFGANTAYGSYLGSITIEAAGTLEVPTPWNTNDLANIFYDQSGDVLFVAGGRTIQQRRIERRGLTTTDLHSWGVAHYFTDDGPFRAGNISDVTLTPSGTTGHPTLTASRPIFQSGHAGALFRLTHSGQSATASIGAQNIFTSAVRISGLASHNFSASSRSFAITVTGISGTGTTVTLQRSIGAIGSWTDVESYTTDTSKTFDDGLDNQIIFYRLGVKTGNYVAGTAVCNLNYSGAAQTGTCRVTDLVSSTVANVDVLAEFGNTTATTDWDEGEWSSYRGFPTAVALHDGRLFWFGGIKEWGSVSDGFNSFDPETVGDAGPINRNVATGGQDGVRAALSLQRLIAFTAQQEISIRSNSFDEPLTNTAHTARACATRGAFRLRAIKVDQVGIYAGRDGKRIFRLAFDLQKGDYTSKELTRLKQEMCAAGVKSVAVQRQPDTRVWFVLNDGTCAVLTYEPEDEVEAWMPQNTTGSFESVAVLPGTDEDEVYFTILRGSSRFIEKLAKRSEAGIAAISKVADCHVFAAGPTASVGFSHMPNTTAVVVWANGVPLPGPFTVAAGAVALGGTFSNVTVGLGYTAQLKTAKLAYAAEHGTPLEQQKRIARVGLVMADTVPEGVRIGRDFSHLAGLPRTYKGKPLTAGQTLASWDAVPGSFNGGWDSDSRVCVQVAAPYPCTLMGLVLQQETNEPFTPDRPPRDG
jgi:hypothetical protein